MNSPRQISIAIVISLFILTVYSGGHNSMANEPPVADAGSSRYAATEPVHLDGSNSYDPDESGPLSYTWRQVSGPPADISQADAPTPIVGGFVQTDTLQELTFELVVSDGQAASLPGTVKVVVVPGFGESSLELTSASFDPDKPTFIYFGGGDCITGYQGQIPAFLPWMKRANAIGFPQGYSPDQSGSLRTYYKYADMIIVYLSSEAPDYTQPIQTAGWSTGGQPALDVGVHMNRTYRDPRYAVNRVTFLDVGYCLQQPERINVFLDNPVDSEQCWIDNYDANNKYYYPNVLNVDSDLSHAGIRNWFAWSTVRPDANKFNGGVIAGMYWSVAGPGKNLQLASTPGIQTYRFKWRGSFTSGYMEFHDESKHPGRLPEPITLLGPVGAVGFDDVVLTCQDSENTVKYELLFGQEPHRVTDYAVMSETPTPPGYVVTELPFPETWWTVRATDQHGSTIYADPLRLDPFLLSLPIMNITAGTTYGYLQTAIDEAADGDVVVAGQGIYHENIDFKGKRITVRSSDSDDPSIVAATVIAGHSRAPVVTFSSDEGEASVLAGLTLQGGSSTIYSRAASPTIAQCIIGQDETTAVQLSIGSKPALVDCTLFGDMINKPEVLNLMDGEVYDDIRTAVSYGVAGDEIVVGPGTYEENIEIAGRNLILRSVDPNDPAIVAATVIHADGVLVDFGEGVDRSCVFSGFTLRGGTTGIRCVGAHPTISRCRITGSAATGVELEDSSPIIAHCVFSNNTALVAGGGLYNSGGSPDVTNCTFHGNTASFAGGGIANFSGAMTITNCILWGNAPDQISSFARTQVSYSDIQGGWHLPGEGNLDLDPLFADPDSGDYHLKSQAGCWEPVSESWGIDDVTSPCIDAGDPDMGVGDEPQPNGGRINMGAYGGTAEASKSPIQQ